MNAIEPSLAPLLALGFSLGVSHALDPDHVAAVGTLVSEQRRLSRSCLLGACWGVGHTLALLAAGGAVIAFRLTITPAMERGLEMAVALLLIGLGGRVLARVARQVSLHRHPHVHGGRAHAHVHLHVAGGTHESPGHSHLAEVGGRPLLVGLLHGLAGSAALTLVALGAVSSPAAGLGYILVFGLGSTAGMLALSGVIGLPFALGAGRSLETLAVLRVLAGGASIVLGVWLAWKLGG